MDTPASPPPENAPRAADVGEFSALLAEVMASALKTAMFLTRNAADAEDLVQDAAIQAFRSFGSFERGTNFKAWFLKIQYHCFLGRLRRDARRPQTTPIEDDDWADSLLLEHTRGEGLQSGNDPAGELLNRLDSEEIADALRALPPEFRAVAALYFLEEMSYEQIAGIVDCPLNTVRSRLHRSRRLLQKSLWEIARERGLVSGESEEGASQK